MSNGRLKFELEDAFNKIGTTMYPHMTDTYCCQLLAWLLAHGGEYEAVVRDVRLNGDILIAQKRLNIYGGETPNIELVGMMQGFIKELKKNEQCIWVQEIYKRYNLKHK